MNDTEKFVYILLKNILKEYKNIQMFTLDNVKYKSSEYNDNIVTKPVITSFILIDKNNKKHNIEIANIIKYYPKYRDEIINNRNSNAIIEDF